MKIPDNRRTSAPDSIPLWHIPFNSNSIWQKQGYAIKNGDYYEKKITDKGYWNFAEQTNGVYVKVHLQTIDSLPIINTRFKLTSSTDEISDNRSDAEGNSLVFVPINKPLNIEIINDQGINPQILRQDLGVVTVATEKTFQIPDRSDIIKLYGTVYNCDGSLFGNGTAVISMKGAKDEISTPVKDGSFSVAQWIQAYHRDGSIKIYNTYNTLVMDYPYGLGTDINFSYNRIQIYTPNFYTCNNSSQVFCNYKIDSIQYNLNGDTANSSSTFKAIPQQNFPKDFNVVTEKDGRGVEFIFFHTTTKEDFILGPGFKVNGVPYSWVNTDLSITRLDESSLGFIEGWFYLTYKDSSGLLHTVSGNFRVKKQS